MCSAPYPKNLASIKIGSGTTRVTYLRGDGEWTIPQKPTAPHWTPPPIDPTHVVRAQAMRGVYLLAGILAALVFTLYAGVYLP